MQMKLLLRLTRRRQTRMPVQHLLATSTSGKETIEVFGLRGDATEQGEHDGSISASCVWRVPTLAGCGSSAELQAARHGTSK